MMKERLRVKFVDFWVDMNKPEDNFFYEALSKNYEVEFSDQPEIVFYSCFGNDHLKYTCTRIFYSTENWRANFDQCDYAITFDFVESKSHLRWPLWTIYYPSNFSERTNLEERFKEWSNRKNFCCIIVSNPNAKERIDFFYRLNDKLKVDSAGKWNKTISEELLPGSKNKVDFIKNYRFVISFENSSYPGYTTEKLVEPMLAGCIPIYWGDPNVGEDFNLSRFINVEGSDKFDETIKCILAIEKDRDLAKEILGQPIFPENKTPKYLEKDYLSNQLAIWVRESKGRGFRGVGANVRERSRFYFSRFKTRVRSIIKSQD